MMQMMAAACGQAPMYENENINAAVVVEDNNINASVVVVESSQPLHLREAQCAYRKNYIFGRH